MDPRHLSLPTLRVNSVYPAHLEAIALPGSTGLTRMQPNTAQQLADLSTSASYCSIADAMSAAPVTDDDPPDIAGATSDMIALSQTGATSMCSQPKCVGFRAGICLTLHGAPTSICFGADRDPSLNEATLVRQQDQNSHCIAIPFNYLGVWPSEPDRDCADTSTGLAPLAREAAAAAEDLPPVVTEAGWRSLARSTAASWCLCPAT